MAGIRFIAVLAALALALAADSVAGSAERAPGVRAAARSGGAAARAGLEAQMAAWNRGDLEGALAAYWDSAAMTWVSRSGVERGFAAFAAGMRADFADRTKMGVYSAQLLDQRDLGPGSGLIVFRWRIVRDGKRIMGGVSTQIWRDFGRGWKVVFEHAG